ncbi:hypothetical protein C8R43DRAFT_1210301 [Mycena crocata]|nr:hypothetical protein C8R43DRAFT_1210301 [Mycena crocata]
MHSRRVANAVCAPRASAENIERFASLLKDLPSETSLDLLPVCYVLLDPVHIPSAEDLESPSLGTIRTITRAQVGLKGILAVQIPPDVGAEVWPRFWSWIQFFLLFGEYLAAFNIEILSEKEFGLGCATFGDDICTQNSNRRLVTLSPGFQTLMVRTWASLLYTDANDQHGIWMHLVLGFLLQGLPHQLDDIRDGAGGTFYDLATLVMRHISLIGKFTEESESRRPLCVALVARGFAEALTVITCVLSRTEMVDSQHVSQCLLLLAAALTTEHGSRRVSVAVRHGLLNAIVTCAERDFSAAANAWLRFLLDKVLGPATTSCYALADIGTAFLAVSAEDSLARSKIIEVWIPFTVVIRARLGVLRTFDSRENSSLRACDNINCGAIRSKRSFRTCSACCNVFYCGRECQILDWREGGHRHLCETHEDMHTSSSFLQVPANSPSTVKHLPPFTALRTVLTSRERAFLCTLLDFDYRMSRSDIYALYVSAWATNPGAGLVTVFDYGSTQVQIGVQVVEKLEESELARVSAIDVYARNTVRCAVGSAGRMAVDIMTMRQGGRKVNWVMPRRGGTPTVHEALQVIAAKMGAAGSVDAADFQEEIDDAVRLDEAVEIH